jgi:hypothetical protein
MAEMSLLRRRMIEDMTIRNLSPATSAMAPMDYPSGFARRTSDRA